MVVKIVLEEYSNILYNDYAIVRMRMVIYSSYKVKNLKKHFYDMKASKFYMIFIYVKISPVYGII